MNDILWLISTSFENTIIVMLYKKVANNSRDRCVIKDIIFIMLSVIEASICNIIGSHFNGAFNDFFNTIIYLVFGMIFIMLIYKENLIDSFIYYILCESTLFVMELLALILMNLVRTVVAFKNMYLFNLMGSIITLILGIVFYVYFPMRIFDKYRNILNQLKFILFNLILYIFIAKFMLFYNPSMVRKHYIVMIILSIIYVFINIMFVIYNYKIINQKSKLEIYDKYMPTTLGLMEEVKRRQHDFKNHINTIYGIVQTSDTENLKQDLQEYITSLDTSFKGMDEIIKIDNGIVASIIYSKLLAAKQKGIELIYKVECSLKAFPLENYEISEMLNNLIDNALEAVDDEEEEYRSVDLQLGYDEGKYFIETRNAGLKVKTNEINKIFNRGFSTKGTSNHGYGLYNVKKIVEKYNGYFEVSVEDKYLIIKLCIPN